VKKRVQEEHKGITIRGGGNEGVQPRGIGKRSYIRKKDLVKKGYGR